jgi:hypothetical protein
MGEEMGGWDNVREDEKFKVKSNCVISLAKISATFCA